MLPEFKDDIDYMDSHLERFERFKKSQQWVESDWSITISTRLTGRALDV